jgi:formiminoglutamate deiminase
MASLWFHSALLSEGWAERVRLNLNGGRIEFVETGVDAATADERHDVALPGLCNVHSHAFQRGMAGLAETRGPVGDNFWTWREVMYRFLDRLSPDDMQAIAALAYMEMLESGFTRVGEFHYVHHDPKGAPYANAGELAERVAAASREAGIGLTLLPVFYAHSNFGGAAPAPGQRRFINTVASFTRLMQQCAAIVSKLDDANFGVAPHSLRAATEEELKAIVPLALGGPVHIHAAEQMKEVEDSTAWSGARPVEWLLDHGADRHWCLVHATHMTDAETKRFAQSGAVAGLCPITEANLGDGVFPAQDYLSQAGRFGIGTDSNVQIDMAGELRLLEYAQRLTRRARNVLAPEQGRSTGRALFDGALAGGAQALGQKSHGLRQGAPADIVSLDANDPRLAGRKDDALLDSWIFAGARPDCVWRFGRKVVEKGRHRSRDAVAARYRETLRRLLA